MAGPATPQQRPRGTIETVARTFAFHVLSVLFGVLLLFLLCVTLGGLVLTLFCVFTGSTRMSRVFVASMWRTEMRINSLVGDATLKTQESSAAAAAPTQSHSAYRPLASQSSSSAMNGIAATVPEMTPPSRGREVTSSVMVFSILYFLIFRSLFNVIFSVLPLLLWLIAVVQFVPSLASSEQPDMVLASGTFESLFVGVAFTFFAHQIGVSAAGGSLFVSTKMQGLLFTPRESARGSRRDPSRAPLLTSDSFSHASFAEYQSMRQDNQMALNFVEENRYGEELRPHEMRDRPPRPLRSKGVRQEPSGPARASPAAPALPPPPAPLAPPPPPFGGRPGMPGIPPITAFPPHAPGMHHLDEAYQDESATQEIQLCCLKVTVTDGNRGRGSRNMRGGRGGRQSFRAGRGLSFHGGRGGMDGGSFEQGSGWPPFGNGPAFGPARLGSSDAGGAVSVKVRSLSTSSSSSSSLSDSDDARSALRKNRDEKGHDAHRRHGRHNRKADCFRHKRSNSIDSMQRLKFRSLPAVDLKHAAHTNMYEVLDLGPSAPPLPTESLRRESTWHSSAVPVARRADAFPPTMTLPYTQNLHKSVSEDGQQRARVIDTHARPPPTGSNALEMFTAKQKLKEQARQLKEMAIQRKVELKRQLKREASQIKEESRRLKVETKRLAREEVLQSNDQTRSASDDARRAMDAARRAHDEARRAHEEHMRSLGQRKLSNSLSVRSVSRSDAPPARPLEQQLQYRNCVDDDEERKGMGLIGRSDSKVTSSWPSSEQEREVNVRDMFAREIELAAQEEIEKQRRELEQNAIAGTAGGGAFTVTQLARTASDSRIRSGPARARRAVSNDVVVQSGEVVDDVQVGGFVGPSSSDVRPVSVVSQYQAGLPTDQELQGIYGSIPRNIDDQDYTGLNAFGGITFSSSPADLVTAIDTGPLYRGQPQVYDAFPESPLSSPVSFGGSFLDSRQYDVLSPRNSFRDADFPSEEFQQVYRSIRYTEENRVVPSQISSLPNFEDVPGKRDKVHFCSFAPPSVCPARKPFNFAVWAFLLNQRQEMRELAETVDPTSRQLSVDTQMVVRRGALVHVTLEVPSGFKILNGATQGFPWEGKVANVMYDIECTDGADFGQVLFKARIVVGTEVAVLRSYVMVSSKKLEPGELEAQMLESKLEVLEKTYQEVPYSSLEMKELVGSGYFGDAYRAKYNGEDVVVKTIRASEFGETNDQILKEFQHEAAVLSMFGNHPCVVPFVGASTDMRYPLSLVTKYLPYGSLEDNIRKPDETRGDLSVQQRTLMLKDAAAGLLNIHEGGFIHRDIAARNCLVDQDLRVKICDFGLCRRVNAYGGSLMKDSVGPVKYMAPESLQPPHAFSYDSDSWMFGVLMWETYTASAPFATMTPVEAMMKVLRGERLAVPKDLPAEIQSLMESCFHDSPSQRPSMAEILTSLDHSVSPPTPRTSVVTMSDTALASLNMSSTAALNRRDRSIWV